MGLKASTAFRPFTLFIVLRIPSSLVHTRTENKTAHETENSKKSRSSGHCVNAQDNDLG